MVRHAVAVARKDWPGDDRRRPLTARGDRQAAALPELLAEASFEAVVSSPTERCEATVRPLAAARGMRVKTSKALAEGRGDDAIDLVLDAIVDLVFCTHGDVVEIVIAQLRRLGWALPPHARTPKGGSWKLSRERCEFLPAPA